MSTSSTLVNWNQSTLAATLVTFSRFVLKFVSLFARTSIAAKCVGTSGMLAHFARIPVTLVHIFTRERAFILRWRPFDEAKSTVTTESTGLVVTRGMLGTRRPLGALVNVETFFSDQLEARLAW